MNASPVHRRLFLLCCVAVAPLAASAQNDAETAEAIDPVTVSSDLFTVILDNEHVRVVRYRIEPGQRDEWHTHPSKVSYVVAGGTLMIHLDDGTSFVVEEETGTASWMGRVGRHYAENVGDTAVEIVLTEVKGARSPDSD